MSSQPARWGSRESRSGSGCCLARHFDADQRHKRLIALDPEGSGSCLNDTRAGPRAAWRDVEGFAYASGGPDRGPGQRSRGRSRHSQTDSENGVPDIGEGQPVASHCGVLASKRPAARSACRDRAPRDNTGTAAAFRSPQLPALWLLPRPAARKTAQHPAASGPRIPTRQQAGKTDPADTVQRCEFPGLPITIDGHGGRSCAYPRAGGWKPDGGIVSWQHRDGAGWPVPGLVHIGRRPWGRKARFWRCSSARGAVFRRLPVSLAQASRPTTMDEEFTFLTSTV